MRLPLETLKRFTDAGIRSTPLHTRAERFVSENLPYRPEEKIADVGAGIGDLWQGLPHKNVTLVDVLKYSGGNRVLAYAERLPFPKASFHHAVCGFSLQLTERDEALAEISRVLKPGGKLILLLHHPESDATRDAESFLEAHKILQGVFQKLAKLDFNRNPIRQADEKLSKLFPGWQPVSTLSREELERQIHSGDSDRGMTGTEFIKTQVRKDLLFALAYTHSGPKAVGDPQKRAALASGIAGHLDRIGSVVEVYSKAVSGNKELASEGDIRRALAKHGMEAEIVDVLSNEGHKAFAIVARKPIE